MGFMDKLGGLFGGKKAAPETVKGPSTVLRENGIDPSNLKFSFNQDGSVTVAGHAADQAECDRICEVVGDMAQVKSVRNEIVVGAPEPAPAVEEAPVEVAAEEPVVEEAPEAESADDENTYTVEAGDTLWAISEKVYGSGGKYMKIFEANTSILDSPDKIFPGQKLVIPEIEK
jgi:nucleoid-associated protein YgaU